MIGRMMHSLSEMIWICFFIIAKVFEQKKIPFPKPSKIRSLEECFAFKIFFRQMIFPAKYIQQVIIQLTLTFSKNGDLFQPPSCSF